MTTHATGGMSVRERLSRSQSLVQMQRDEITILSQKLANAIADNRRLRGAATRFAGMFGVEVGQPCVEEKNALGDTVHKQPHGHFWFADTCSACQLRAALSGAKPGGEP